MASDFDRREKRAFFGFFFQYIPESWGIQSHKSEKQQIQESKCLTSQDRFSNSLMS